METSTAETALPIDALSVSNVQSARDDYISWETYFMSVAVLSAKRSKDPSTQVGACIVNSSNRIVGIGYNGFPRGCSDNAFPWGKRNPDPLDNKYFYVIHAEMNAILNKNSADVEGCRMFVTLYPCNECAKLMIQSGISEIIYLGDKNLGTDSCIASSRMFTAAGVICRKFETTIDSLEICLTLPSVNEN